jgi:hypothetical protein
MKEVELGVKVMLQYHKTTEKKDNKLMRVAWLIPLHDGQLIFQTPARKLR